MRFVRAARSLTVPATSRIEKNFTAKLKAECEKLLADIHQVQEERNAALQEQREARTELEECRQKLEQESNTVKLLTDQKDKLTELINATNENMLLTNKAALVKEEKLEKDLLDYFHEVKNKDARLTELSEELDRVKLERDAFRKDAERVPFLENKLDKGAAELDNAITKIKVGIARELCHGEEGHGGGRNERERRGGFAVMRLRRPCLVLTTMLLNPPGTSRTQRRVEREAVAHHAPAQRGAEEVHLSRG